MKKWISVLFVVVLLVSCSNDDSTTKPDNIPSSNEVQLPESYEQVQKLVIGVVIPLSGNLSREAIQIKNGIDTAMMDYGSKNIILTYGDSGCSVTKVVEGFNKVMLFDNVTHIIGGVCQVEAPILRNLTMEKNITFVQVSTFLYQKDYFQAGYDALENIMTN
jgi:ABC-type branched-subunit amino acid transport system substrate-binding protein